jgi:uncharacterized membrane protein
MLEKFFGMKLWDYTKVPLNIEGRVAVPVSLFWGVGCLILMKVINPVIQDGIQEFIDATNHLGPIILAALFAADVTSTLIFTLTTKKEVSSVIDTSDPENAAVKEFRLKHLISNHHSSTSREQVLKMIKERPKNLTRRNLNRLAKNYPNMHFKK